MFKHKFLTQRDTLTGALTRQALPALWRICVTTGNGSVALCFFDIDYFKSINDAFGHHVGDTVLRHVVSTIQAGVREQDALVRYAGDEFLLFMPGIGMRDAHAIAERLLSRLQTMPLVIDGREIRLTLSIGVAACPEDGTTLDQLIQVADRRAYQAKQAGRARVVSKEAHLLFQQALNNAWVEANRESISRFRAWLLAERTQSFRIEGLPNSGTSHMAALFTRLAAHEGWRVLSAQALNTARNRHYAVMFQLMERAGQFPFSHVEKWLDWFDAQEAPLLLLVENAENMDEASALFLQALLGRTTGSHLRLLMTSAPLLDHEHTHHMFPAAVVVRTRLLNEATVKSLLVAEFGSFIGRWITPIYRITQGAMENVLTLAQLLRSGHTFYDYSARQGAPLITDRTVQRVLEEWAYRVAPPFDEQKPHGQQHHVEEFVTNKAFHKLASALHTHQRIVVSGIKGVGKTTLLAQVAREHAERQGIPLLELTLPTAGTPAILETILRHHYVDLQKQQFWQNWPAEMSAFDGVILLRNWEGNADETVALLEWLDTTFPHALILVEIGRISFSLAGWHHFVVEPLTPEEGLFFFEQLTKTTLSERERRLFQRALQSTYITPDLLKLGLGYAHQNNVMAFVNVLQESPTSRTQASSEQAILDQILETNLYYWRHMLDEEDRRVIKGLGVFDGAFSAQAAQAVAGVSSFLLQALVARGMVSRVATGYFMLNPGIRAAIRKEMSDEEAETYSRRHAMFFTRLIQESLTRTGRIRRRFPEHVMPNLVAAWHWASTHDEGELWQAILYPFLTYLYQEARFDLLQHLLSQSVEKAVSERFPPAARAIIFYFKSVLEDQIGDAQQTAFWFEQAEQAFEAFHATTKDEKRLKDKLWFNINEGRVFQLMGEGCFEKSQSLAQQLLDSKYVASSLEARLRLITALSGIQFLQQNYQEAERYLRQVLALVEQFGSEDNWRATTLNNLASALYHQGKLDEALSMAQEALAYYERHHQKMAAASVLDTLADIHRLKGESAQAAFAWYRALVLAHDVCAWSVRNELLAGVVSLLADMGAMQQAERLARALAADTRSVYLVHSRIKTILANATPTDEPIPSVEEMFYDVLDLLWQWAHA